MQQVYHTRTTFINKKLRKLEFFFWKTNNYIKSWIFYKTFGGLKSKTWELQAYTHAAKKDFLSPFSLSVVKLKKTLVTSKIVHCDMQWILMYSCKKLKNAIKTYLKKLSKFHMTKGTIPIYWRGQYPR